MKTVKVHVRVSSRVEHRPAQPTTMDSRDVAAGGGSREADVIEIDVRGPGSTKGAYK